MKEIDSMPFGKFTNQFSYFIFNSREYSSSKPGSEGGVVFDESNMAFWVDNFLGIKAIERD